MKWHKLEPFNYFYCLATEAEMKEWFKKKKATLPEIPENAYGYAVHINSRTFIVLVPQKKQNTWEDIGTIIHESVHIFQNCMKWIGEGDIGHEMEAYTIEAISVNLLKDYHNALPKERR
jgi:hypothetical protein